MQEPSVKPHRHYVDERIERDPEFAVALEEADADIAFALELVKQRERLGWSQRRLAEASGIKQPMIARIERGSQSPRYSTIRKLLKALGASLVVTSDERVSVCSEVNVPTRTVGWQRVREPAGDRNIAWLWEASGGTASMRGGMRGQTASDG